VCREARHRARWSPDRAGEHLGVIPAAIEAYETGVTPPLADTFLAALTAGGLDVRPLLRSWLDGERDV
jgi:hypothetical protein